EPRAAVLDLGVVGVEERASADGAHPVAHLEHEGLGGVNLTEVRAPLPLLAELTALTEFTLVEYVLALGDRLVLVVDDHDMRPVPHFFALSFCWLSKCLAKPLGCFFLFFKGYWTGVEQWAFGCEA